MTWPNPLLAVITACAVWVALQQMIIARKKLNHDLFDRRFAVFTATQDFLFACLNRSLDMKADIKDFSNAIRAAPFLFDKDVNDFLLEILDTGKKIQIFAPYVTRRDIPDHESQLEDYTNAHDLLWEESESLTSRFEPTMNLANTKAFPIISVVPLPDLRPLRDRIRRSIRPPERDKGHAE